MCDKAVVFVDYENARWHARRLFRTDTDGHFDPLALAVAVCEKAGDRQVLPALIPIRVRVYLGRPTKDVLKACEYWDRQPSGWPSHGESVSAFPFDISLRGQSQSDQKPADGGHPEIKEMHVQMSVDIFNWALQAADGSAEADVAILFTDDRDLAPAVRKVATMHGENDTPRLDLAGWVGRSRAGGEMDAVLSVDDLKLPERIIDWDVRLREAESA